MTKVYSEDLAIAKAIISKDERTTREYLYKKYYPMFFAIYNNYHTDCTSCREFINEIYLLILTPGRKSGKCQLENYKGESSLSSWLKTVCLFYCYKKYKHRTFDTFSTSEQKKSGFGDNKPNNDNSLFMRVENIDKNDVDVLLGMMTNENYRIVIRKRYIEEKDHKEIAEELGVTMENYYNIHKRAKEQFVNIYKKEERYGK